MAKSFDFNKIKPKTMNVTLSDEEKTTLVLMTPSKGLKDELSYLTDNINEEDDEETIEALYNVASKILSRNTQNIEITSERLRELYPDENYIIAFLQSYGEFVYEATNSKN